FRLKLERRIREVDAARAQDQPRFQLRFRLRQAGSGSRLDSNSDSVKHLRPWFLWLSQSTTCSRPSPENRIKIWLAKNRNSELVTTDTLLSVSTRPKTPVDSLDISPSTSLHNRLVS